MFGLISTATHRDITVDARKRVKIRSSKSSFKKIVENRVISVIQIVASEHVKITFLYVILNFERLAVAGLRKTE